MSEHATGFYYGFHSVEPVASLKKDPEFAVGFEAGRLKREELLSQANARHETAVEQVKALEDSKTIWVVVSLQGGKEPSEAYTSFTSANKEAQRLASLNPGVKFWVMESCVAYTGEVSVKQTNSNTFKAG